MPLLSPYSPLANIMYNKSMARPAKYTKKELDTLVAAYFTLCEKTNKAPTKGGLGLFLDVTREYFRDNIEKNTELADTIKKAYEEIEEVWIQMLSSKGYSAAGVIFYLKNAYKWRDRLETDVTSGGKAITSIDSSKIAQDLYNLTYGRKNPTESNGEQGGEEKDSN